MVFSHLVFLLMRPLRVLLHTSLAVALCHCALLAVAAADIITTSDVSFVIVQSPEATTQAAQAARCASSGGALFTDVSTALHQQIVNMAESLSKPSMFGYLGGSTTASPRCFTTVASLDCLWLWNTGRYAAAGAALPFYLGNSPPSELAGAGPVDGMPSYWQMDGTVQMYPGPKRQQYVMFARTSRSPITWKDSSPTELSYDTASPSAYYAFCQVEKATTTTTSSSSTTTQAPAPTTTTTTSTTAAPTTDTTTTTTTTSSTAEPTSTKIVFGGEVRHIPSGLGSAAWAGIGVAIGVVVVGAVVAVLCVCAKIHGWWCFAGKSRASSRAGHRRQRAAAERPPNCGNAAHASPSTTSSSSSSSSTRSSSSSSHDSSPSRDHHNVVVSDKHVSAVPSPTYSNNTAIATASSQMYAPSPDFHRPQPQPPSQQYHLAVSRANSMSYHTVAHSTQPSQAWVNPLLPPPTRVIVPAPTAPPHREPSPDVWSARYGDLSAVSAVSAVSARSAGSRVSRLENVQSPQRPLSRRSSSVSFVGLSD